MKAEFLGSNADSSSSRLALEIAEMKLVAVIDFSSKGVLKVDPESRAVDPFANCREAILESRQIAIEKADQSLCSLVKISCHVIPEFARTMEPCPSRVVDLWSCGSPNKQI